MQLACPYQQVETAKSFPIQQNGQVEDRQNIQDQQEKGRKWNSSFEDHMQRGRDSVTASRMASDRVNGLNATEAENIGQGVAIQHVPEDHLIHPNLHDYTITSPVCNLEAKNCNLEDVVAMAAKITPPQSICDFSQSSCNGEGEHNLFSGFGLARANGMSFLVPTYNNPITTWEDEATNSSGNTTRPGHMFHPGDVIHSVFEYDGQIVMHTLGTGTKGNGWLNEQMGPPLISQTHEQLREHFAPPDNNTNGFVKSAAEYTAETLMNSALESGMTESAQAILHDFMDGVRPGIEYNQTRSQDLARATDIFTNPDPSQPAIQRLTPKGLEYLMDSYIPYVSNKTEAAFGAASDLTISNGPTQPLGELLEGNKSEYFQPGMERVLTDFEYREGARGESTIDASTENYTHGTLGDAGFIYLAGTLVDQANPFKTLDVGDVTGTPTYGVNIVPDDDRINLIFANNTTLNSFTGANMLARDNFEENTPGTEFSPVTQIYAFSIPNTLTPKDKPPVKIPELRSIP